MPIEGFEMASSRESKTGKNPSIRLMYFLRGSDVERDIRLWMLDTNNVPLFYETLVKTGTDQHPLGNGCWTGSADYGMPEFALGTEGAGGSGGGDSTEPAGGDSVAPSIRVSIGGRMQHITQALFVADEAKKTTDPNPIPDCKGTIGGSNEGVAGCDIPVPEITWSESWFFYPQFVTWDYIKDLRTCYGRANLVSFRTHLGGEVRFLGAEIDHGGTDFTKVNFNFAAEQNVVGFQLTPEFDPVDKEGQQYLAVEYERAKDDPVAAKKLVQVPLYVRVFEVGRPGPTNKANFDILRIGR